MWGLRSSGLRSSNLRSRQGDLTPARFLPVITLFLAAVATVLPFPIPGYVAVVPLFTLMPVYYWTVYRPDLLRPPGIFAGGVVLDLLSGAPLGLSSLLLLLAQMLVLTQRRFFVDRLFPFLWLGFTLLAAAAVAFLWLAGGMMGGLVLDPRPATLQWVLSVACFPVVGYVLMRIQRRFLAIV